MCVYIYIYTYVYTSISPYLRSSEIKTRAPAVSGPESIDRVSVLMRIYSNLI